MSTAAQIQQLRSTAANLRSVSGLIANSRALTVYSVAGPETWIGPTPQSCYDQLLSIRRQLQSNQQSLTDTARHLDRQAMALEAQTALASLVS
ncbi:MAG: hypothetical protein QOE09_2616 [Ilumatobacteraceae bacterium]|jgi:hypothetical protein